MEPVRDMDIVKGASVEDVLRQMGSSGGFTAKDLAAATDIAEKMAGDSESVNFLSFPADIVATGTRGVIRDMVKDNMFKVIITTSGTLDHDIARCYRDYYEGSFDADDAELAKEGLNRLGNVFVPNESYGELIEDKMKEFLSEIVKEKSDVSTHELCWEIGKRLNNEGSILYWAWKNQIPVVVPGITDGAVGYQLWHFSQENRLNVNVLKDEQLLSDMVWNAKRLGALIVGGGISKHHVIWWSQFGNGLDRAVYMSSASERDGSLSGARPREAVSWKKIKPEARHAFVYGDATVNLPLMYAALLGRLSE